MLALAPEFNCFLRTRCSMEMWCPGDMGRDSWDWVGPPAWVRACFNSPEWGGGSSPVKTEPPQIVLLLLFGTRLDVCVWSRHNGRCNESENKFTCVKSPASQTPGDPATPGSRRRRRTLRHRSENWRSTPGQPGGARKMPTPTSPPNPR